MQTLLLPYLQYTTPDCSFNKLIWVFVAILSFSSAQEEHENLEQNKKIDMGGGGEELSINLSINKFYIHIDQTAQA